MTDATPATHADNPPIHLVIYGDSGAGKSTCAATFPSPVRVWLFDAPDKAAPYRRAAKAGKDITVEMFHDPLPEMGGKGWAQFLKRARDYVANKEYLKDRTLIVDSVTFMELAARKYDQYVTNQRARDPRQHFAASTEALEEILMIRLMALPINVVVLCHIDEERDELHGTMVFNPSAPGRMRKRLAAGYGEFYRAYVRRTETGDKQYLLQTSADARYNAASQIGAPDPAWQDYADLWSPS